MRNIIRTGCGALVVALFVLGAVVTASAQTYSKTPQAQSGLINVPVNAYREFQLSGSAEVNFTGVAPNDELVIIFGASGTVPVEITVGSTVMTLTDDQTVMLPVFPGDTFLVDPSQPTSVNFFAISARAVNSPSRQTGDLGNYTVDYGSGETGHMTGFVVYGTPGERITVDLMSDEIDPLLFGATTDRGLISNDDGGDGLNSRLRVQFDESGRAPLLAMSLGNEPGLYELVISEAAAAAVDTEGGMLQVGSTVDGWITGDTYVDDVGNAISYQLPLSAGQEVTVRLVSDEFDSYLIIRSPDGQTFRDDDSAGSLNSQITFSSDVGGEATVIATSFSRGDTGNFSLSAWDARNANSDDSYGGMLHVGSVVAGQIAGTTRLGDYGSAIRYELPLSAQEAVTIELNSDDFDCYLIVEMPNGESYTDDDGGYGLDSRLTVSSDVSGTATVIATSLGRSSTGSFELSVHDAGEIGATDSADGGVLPIGSWVTGEITRQTRVEDGLAVTYRLPISAGDLVTIDLTSDDFDCYLQVETPDGEWYSDDDGGSGLNSRVTVSSSVSGTAIVTASGLGRGSTGRYQIRATVEDSSAYSSDGGMLYVGSSVEARITPMTTVGDYGNAVQYQVPLSAGEPVTIGLTSDDFDSYLIVVMPNGREYTDDDGGFGYNSELTVTADMSGTATVIATSLGRRSSGYFELSVRQAGQLLTSAAADGGILPTNTWVSGTITSQTEVEGVGNAIGYQLPLSAGDQVTIDLESSDFDCYLVVYMPDGSRYTDDDGGSGFDSRLQVTASVGGTANVIATSLGRSSTGEFRIRAQSGVPVKGGR